MKMFILWALFSGGGHPAIASAEYTSYESCMKAKEQLVQLNRYFYSNAVCTEK